MRVRTPAPLRRRGAHHAARLGGARPDEKPGHDHRENPGCDHRQQRMGVNHFANYSEPYRRQRFSRKLTGTRYPHVHRNLKRPTPPDHLVIISTILPKIMRIVLTFLILTGLLHGGDLERARAFYDHTDYNRAIGLLTREPAAPPALELLGQSYFMLAEYKKGDRNLRKGRVSRSRRFHAAHMAGARVGTPRRAFPSR